MKRVRFVDRSKLTFFQKIRPVILLLVGWHAAGLFAKNYLQKGGKEVDPQFDSKPEDEQISLLSRRTFKIPFWDKDEAEES